MSIRNARSRIGDAAYALQARLRTPAVPVPARQRARLQTRLDRIESQHAWGDMSDAEYQAERDKVRSDLRELPDDDRVRSFDTFRTCLLELPDAITAASPARREELCRIVVQQVIVDDRELESIIWTPPAAPFFDRQRWRPPVVFGWDYLGAIAGSSRSAVVGTGAESAGVAAR